MNHTTLLPIAGILAVEIPKETPLRLWKDIIGEWVLYFKNGQEVINTILPPGEWELLFTTLTMTEDDAKGLIPDLIFGRFYKDYTFQGEPIYAEPYTFDTAIESFHSLLRANGLDPVKFNYAILRNNLV